MLEILKKILNFFYFKQKYQSPKNGEIIVVKNLFWYEVLNGGCFQSGPYVNHLWKKLLKRVPRNRNKLNVLLLGLGGGGAIKEIQKRFKRATITAIEYDPVMIKIAHKTFLKGINLEKIKILEGDATEKLQQVEEKYDIILVDLFNGKVPSPSLYSPDFLRLVKERLERDGYLLVNFYRNKKDLGEIFDRHFSRWRDLKYSYNRMAVYRHFGLGNPNDPLPDGFQNKEQSLLYLQTQIKNPKRQKIVGSKGAYGLRKDFLLFATENYVSKTEPQIEILEKPRIIFWQTLKSKNKIHAWHRNLLASRAYINGIAILEDKNYWQKWSLHAQRHRKKWQKSNQYEIIEANFDDFKKAYYAAKRLDWLMLKGFIRVLNFHLKRHGQDVHLFIAREKESQKIFAGLAVVDYPDISLSIHTISFINKDFKNTSAGVGLIDYWHQHCLKNKIKFLNFGIIWRKGDPKSWKGYSKFKKQFNIYQIIFARSYFKFLMK